MSLDMTAFDAALKEYYTSQAVQNMVYRDQPFLAMLSKMTNFEGDSLPVPILHGNPQNRSAAFATAQAGTSTSLVKKFVLTRVKDYSIATIDHETMMASRSDKGAFLSATTTEIDGALHSLSRSLGTALFGDGNGSIGVVSAEPAEAANTVITLATSSDITNFEVGMVVNIHSALTGGSQRNIDGSTTDLTIDAVNRVTGVISINGQAYTSSGTIAANDFIFVKGDRGVKIKGLAAWLPSSSPSATAFFGVDRTVDETRLAGVRSDGTGKPIEEALVDAAVLLGREGGSPDVCFVSFNKFGELEKSLGSKVQYSQIDIANAGVGFEGIRIHGPRRSINVIPDVNCPDNRAYMLQMDTWKLYSLGECPTLFDADGTTMLRQTSADGVEIRAFYYAQLGCNAPGNNAVVLLD